MDPQVFRLRVFTNLALFDFDGESWSVLNRNKERVVFIVALNVGHVKIIALVDQIK